MSRRRDRHQRGLRGPMSQPSAYTGRAAPVLRRMPATAFFDQCVADAVGRIEERCPQAIRGVRIGIEEVPVLVQGWDQQRVPLAAAIDASDAGPAHVVVYRRPLEHRAATRPGLAILVHRTIVEQLSALTGISVDEIDPEGYSEDDED